MKQLPSILIFHSNDQFRSMLKDMLIKHGYFYLLDTSDESVFWRLKENNNEQFILIESDLVSRRVIEEFKNRKKSFLILGQVEEKKTHDLSTLFGVESLMSFPFPSVKLSEKILQRS